MKLVERWHLPGQAWIDLGFFVGVPIVLAMLSAALGPYVAIMGGAGAFAYVLALAVVPWWLTGLATSLASRGFGQKLPLWLIAGIGAIAAGPAVSIYAWLVKGLVFDIWPGLGGLLPATFSAAHLKSAILAEGRAVVLWIAFVVIFRETLGWGRFSPSAAEPRREERFQMSGAGWTAEDDALLRILVGRGEPPRAIALEMKRTIGGIRARTTKLGLRNNRAGDRSGN